MDATLLVTAGGGADTAGGSRGVPADGARVAVLLSAGGCGADTPDEGVTAARLGAGTNKHAAT